MLATALELVIAPALVGIATLACDRWGERAAGMVAAFPAIVGPVLLVAAQERGARFAATAADATLLGLVALAAFAFSYGRMAVRAGWPASLAVGWAAAAACTLAVGLAGHGAVRVPGAAAAVASLSLWAAHRALPRRGAAGALGLVSRRELWLRMGLAAALVVVLAIAVGRLGAIVGGALAALPVLASLLAVFNHRVYGGSSTVGLLKGMLAGMASFVVFCEAIALLVVPVGTAGAFAAATIAAVGVQAGTQRAGERTCVSTRTGTAEPSRASLPA